MRVKVSFIVDIGSGMLSPNIKQTIRSVIDRQFGTVTDIKIEEDKRLPNVKQELIERRKNGRR